MFLNFIQCQVTCILWVEMDIVLLSAECRVTPSNREDPGIYL